MNHKEVTAEKTTVTRDLSQFTEKSGNIYRSLVAIAKRSNQISAEVHKELSDKLVEFAPSTDSLEEVFENREQIEISKFYEALPKPIAIALQEYLDDDIYIREADEEADEETEATD